VYLYYCSWRLSRVGTGLAYSVSEGGEALFKMLIYSDYYQNTLPGFIFWRGNGFSFVVSGKRGKGLIYFYQPVLLCKCPAQAAFFSL
ncbi:MAG: hypothetical protein ACK52I_36185, partial [Pseudomonadota bacterium]